MTFLQQKLRASKPKSSVRDSKCGLARDSNSWTAEVANFSNLTKKCERKFLLPPIVVGYILVGKGNFSSKLCALSQADFSEFHIPTSLPPGDFRTRTGVASSIMNYSHRRREYFRPLLFSLSSTEFFEERVAFEWRSWRRHTTRAHCHLLMLSTPQFVLRKVTRQGTIHEICIGEPEPRYRLCI